MLGLEITQQTLFLGVVAGLVYAVLAAGFVLVYRATGVLNFAQGEIGAFGVGLFGLLAAGYHVPYWISLLLAVAASALIGMVIELTVVRRLFNSHRLVLLIATIGVAQLLLVARLSLPDTAAQSTFPVPFDISWRPTDDILVLSRDVIVFIMAPLAIIALAYFMTKTRLGLMVRASADNPETARIFGISVKRTSTIVWTITGAFAALTAIMIAPIQGITPGSVVRSGSAGIGATLLVRALVVSLIARMQSLPLTLAGGLAVGVGESLIRANVDQDNQSIIDLWMFIAAVVLVLFWVRKQRAETSWSLTARVKPIPERLKSLWYVRHLNKFAFGALFFMLALIPLFLTQHSQELVWTDVLLFAMMAMPLSMLTGWAGQFSVAQFTFVGLGAGVMVMLTHGLDVPVPFDLWDMSFNLPWVAALFATTIVGACAAVVIGVPALRVRGMFLAVITFAFAVAASNWIFGQGTFTGSEYRSTTPYMQAPTLLGIDFSDRRSFYYLCLLCLALMAGVMARIRHTGLGRSMIAVSGNEAMATASTVSAARIKLVAFAVSGAMAAFAGGLFITLRTFVDPRATFTPGESLRLVATAVIGGLGSVAGAIHGALFVRGLPAIFGDVEEVQLITSGVGLLILLMYFPGGLMQIIYSARDATLAWVERRVAPTAPPIVVGERSVLSPSLRRIHVPIDGVWLQLTDVSVAFGGIRAVDSVTLQVGRGELVGLIGTNGAGKSTLMNAVSGFVPSTGRIELLGRDVTSFTARRRHQVGVGRGFQSASLYPDLTVCETLMVSLEARERSSVLPAMVGLPTAIASEKRKRADANDLIDLLGLGAYSDNFIASLSTGTRRIVELGCLLAADARVLMLDEPTCGVAQRETEAFGPLIVRIQRELGASMLLIEHDMPLIMSISDRMYCLEAGRIIAEGTPHEVRDDPLVIASYLGTDERAIERSGPTLPAEAKAHPQSTKTR